MNTATRHNKGATIMDVAGHIDIGSSPALRKSMLEYLKHSDRLAVNLAGVKYLDSSGIASLLEVLKEARSSKKRFVLFGLTAAVREVLQLTRLTGVFEVYESEDEALTAETAAGGR
ncbi:putative Anti-sigma-B factor antagonist [Candidatus Sulfopaludibacter sp. SbA3]|nr:putative Anti-sigma-B factor antagonist [Candidatus Sulfopaludibacter sp. SbA3]